MEISKDKLEKMLKETQDKAFADTFKWVNYVVQGSDNFAQFKELMQQCMDKLGEKKK